MFGGPTAIRPWDAGKTGLDLAKARVPVFFEFTEKLGAPYYAFHDRDVAPHAATLRESNQWFDTIVALLKEQQQRTGIKLLWGTTQLFVHPRFMHGAATSPNAEVFAFSPEKLPEVRRLTEEYTRKVLALSDEPGKRESVYCLNIHCFDAFEQGTSR